MSDYIHCVLFMIFLHWFPSKERNWNPCPRVTSKIAKYSQFPRAQAASMLNWLAPATREVNKLLNSHEDKILMYMTDVAMSVLRNKISVRINKTIAPELHHEIFWFCGGVASQFKSDHLRCTECIRDLAHLSLYSLQLSETDFLTDKLENDRS